MKENVRKCVSIAMKRFSENEELKHRFGNTVYCPFDPDLSIGGEKIRFIVDLQQTKNPLRLIILRNLADGLVST